eukprot:m.92311 g.92311  ORF g.92311 m.92311 type:complete len:388 (+) comp16520_c0_seq1:237-1400(+)
MFFAKIWVRFPLIQLVFHSLLLSPHSLGVNGLTPSLGCKSHFLRGIDGWPTGRLAKHTVFVDEERFVPIQNLSRTFFTYFPISASGKEPIPLLLYFHGQSGKAREDALSSKYDNISEHAGFTTAYLQGIGDSDGGCGTGWNVGPSAHNQSTCTEYTRSKKCDCTCCYTSCKALGVCSADNEGSQCGWATCYDDVTFVQHTIQMIAQNRCIDLDAIYATGASNGGMFVHYLAAELTHRNGGVSPLSGIIPVYGLPLLGSLDVPNGLHKVPILQIHDRFDTTIPRNGGPSDDGWKYVPLDHVLHAWARTHHCDTGPMVAVATPFDGGHKNISCAQHVCSMDATVRVDGRGTPRTQHPRILRCLYDGEHGSWFGHAEALTWWFVSGHVRR